MVSTLFCLLILYSGCTLLEGTENTDDPELFILLSDFGLFSGSIYRLDFHHWNLTRLYNGALSRPFALDYDPVKQNIYWTDVHTFEIRLANINGSNPQLVYKFDSQSAPEGLSLDTNARELFFTDYYHQIVGKMKMDVKPYRVEIIANLSSTSRPRGIVADKSQRKLYWVDRGNNRIDSCDYNGNNRQTLVSSATMTPNGIAMDERLGKIFWTDHGGKLESINRDGTGRKIHGNDDDELLDITILNGYIFYTAFNTPKIFAQPDDADESFFVTSLKFNQPGGIHAFSPNLNRDVNCKNGYHGYECKACGKCNGTVGCEKTTGICISGCQSGYKRNHCTQVCDPGTHGDDCGFQCGGCKIGTTCNVKTGICPNGCKAGYFGSKCTECLTNTYSPTGTTCIPCGRCSGSATCDKRTGACPSGCATGWKGARCDQKTPVCSFNHYKSGVGCKKCGKCAMTICNVLTGDCYYGCQTGWQGLKCDKWSQGGAAASKLSFVCLMLGTIAFFVKM